MEIICPECGSTEVLIEGGGVFVCCDCDHRWEEKPQSKADHHEESECGHFCTYHKLYECRMIVGGDCNFAAKEYEMGDMEDHIIEKAFEEYTAWKSATFKTHLKSRKGPHLIHLEDEIHRGIDDC
jgi:hypothetical protein